MTRWEYVIECLHNALNLPTSVVITGINSMGILDQACEAVRTFRPMSDEEVRSLLSKTAEAVGRGDFNSRPHPYSTVPPRTRSGWERSRNACSS